MSQERSLARALPLIDRIVRTTSMVYLVALIAGVIAYKASFANQVLIDPLFVGYGLVVAGYILSRFFLSLLYRPASNRGLEPRVAIVVPALNEEEAIASTIETLVDLDYPVDKIEIVAVNDGSTDGTLMEMRRAAGRDPRVRVIDFPENRGKRAAMAEGIRLTDAEFIVFVDSDSKVSQDGLRRIVQPFHDPAVGAVAGHAGVANPKESWISRMQTVRYFAAFRIVKAAESLFGTVTCCSGCFSAYRRTAILPVLREWEDQKFLGKQTTYGDDRSLTNYVLRCWKVVYESTAIANTIVPSTTSQFLKQQMRWKRSWTRESWIVSSFIWRKSPLAAAAIYTGIGLNLLGPIMAVRAVLWQPLVADAGAPTIYLAGVYAMALIYGLYYAIKKGSRDGLWAFGVLFVFFYLGCLIWQTYYALVTCRRNGWGTRTVGQTSVRGTNPLGVPALTPVPPPPPEVLKWVA